MKNTNKRCLSKKKKEEEEEEKGNEISG